MHCQSQIFGYHGNQGASQKCPKWQFCSQFFTQFWFQINVIFQWIVLQEWNFRFTFFDDLALIWGPFFAPEVLCTAVYEILKNMWFFFRTWGGRCPPSIPPVYLFVGGRAPKNQLVFGRTFPNSSKWFGAKKCIFGALLGPWKEGGGGEKASKCVCIQ